MIRAAYIILLLWALPAFAQTTLQIVNARDSELTPLVGPNVRPADNCAFQGCAAPDYATRVTHIVITKIDPWKVPPTRKGFACDVPATATTPARSCEVVAKCPLEADGSVSCQIPQGIVYQLSAIDKDGVTVAKDNSLHYSHGGIVRCGGCHDLHSVEKLAQFNQAHGSLDQAWLKTDAGKKP